MCGKNRKLFRCFTKTHYEKFPEINMLLPIREKFPNCFYICAYVRIAECVKFQMCLCFFGLLSERNEIAHRGSKVKGGSSRPHAILSIFNKIKFCSFWFRWWCVLRCRVGLWICGGVVWKVRLWVRFFVRIAEIFCFLRIFQIVGRRIRSYWGRICVRIRDRVRGRRFWWGILGICDVWRRLWWFVCRRCIRRTI
jgi:hypothetical protein